LETPQNFFNVGASALIAWGAFFAVLPVVTKYRKAGDEVKLIFRHYLLFLIPILLINVLIIINGTLAHPLANSFKGVNFLVVAFAFLGRFQFIRLISLGDEWRAYTSNWERFPIALGLIGFLLSQYGQRAVFSGELKGGIHETTIDIAMAVRPIVLIYFALVMMEFFLLSQQHQSLLTAKKEGREIKALWGIHLLSSIGWISRTGIAISVGTASSRGLSVSLVFFYVVQLLMVLYLHISTVTELPNWVERSLSHRVKLRKTWGIFLEKLESEKLFLNSDLSVEICAHFVGVSEHLLRSAIKQNSEESFKSIVNWFRFRHFVRTYPDMASKHTMEHIAETSGFNSRSTLHRTAKYWFDASPKEVLESDPEFEVKVLTV
jgi:AraC-like DNA-binding protein